MALSVEEACGHESKGACGSSNEQQRVMGGRNALEDTMRDRFIHGGLLCISTMMGTAILLAIALVRAPWLS